MTPYQKKEKGNYKQAAILAEKAMQQTGNVSAFVLALASISLVAVSGGMVLLHYRNGKTKSKKKLDISTSEANPSNLRMVRSPGFEPGIASLEGFHLPLKGFCVLTS